MEEKSWVIDSFKAQDAEGVAALFHEVYGDQYPVKAVYDPQSLVHENGNADAYRIVARIASGEVVGQVALYRSSPPNSRLYEHGQMMVRHDYRNTDVLDQLVRYSMEEVPASHGLEQLWGEAVCNHKFTQRKAIGWGFYATALEVALMPAEAYAKAYTKPQENTGRVAVLAIGRTYKAKAQKIYLPEVYEDQLRYLYSAYDFGHEFIRSNQQLPTEISTRGKTDIFASAGVARITLFEIGKDFAAYMEKAEQEACANGAVVLQVFFSLALPYTGASADVLRDKGYFIGGPLPRWFDNDGLLMQKVLTEPNFEGIQLYPKKNTAILEIVQQDWQATT